MEKLKIERGADGCISIRNPGSYYGTLIGIPSFSWDRRRQILTAPLTLDVLDALAAVTELPDELKSERDAMHARRRMMECMRTEDHPHPVKKPPVKVKLFDHQIRAYNMALLHFGALDADRGGDNGTR